MANVTFCNCILHRYLYLLILLEIFSVFNIVISFFRYHSLKKMSLDYFILRPGLVRRPHMTTLILSTDLNRFMTRRQWYSVLLKIRIYLFIYLTSPRGKNNNNNNKKSLVSHPKTWPQYDCTLHCKIVLWMHRVMNHKWLTSSVLFFQERTIHHTLG